MYRSLSLLFFIEIVIHSIQRSYLLYWNRFPNAFLFVVWIPSLLSRFSTVFITGETPNAFLWLMGMTAISDFVGSPASSLINSGVLDLLEINGQSKDDFGKQRLWVSN